jgi:hypothetical protein
MELLSHLSSSRAFVLDALPIAEAEELSAGDVSHLQHSNVVSNLINTIFSPITNLMWMLPSCLAPSCNHTAMLHSHQTASASFSDSLSFGLT